MLSDADRTALGWQLVSFESRRTRALRRRGSSATSRSTALGQCLRDVPCGAGCDADRSCGDPVAVRLDGLVRPLLLLEEIERGLRSLPGRRCSERLASAVGVEAALEALVLALNGPMTAAPVRGLAVSPPETKRGDVLDSCSLSSPSNDGMPPPPPFTFWTASSKDGLASSRFGPTTVRPRAPRRCGSCQPPPRRTRSRRARPLPSRRIFPPAARNEERGRALGRQRSELIVQGVWRYPGEADGRLLFGDTHMTRFSRSARRDGTRGSFGAAASTRRLARIARFVARRGIPGVTAPRCRRRGRRTRAELLKGRGARVVTVELSSAMTTSRRLAGDDGVGDRVGARLTSRPGQTRFHRVDVVVMNRVVAATRTTSSCSGRCGPADVCSLQLSQETWWTRLGRDRERRPRGSPMRLPLVRPHSPPAPRRTVEANGFRLAYEHEGALWRVAGFEALRLSGTMQGYDGHMAVEARARSMRRSCARLPDPPAGDQRGSRLRTSTRVTSQKRARSGRDDPVLRDSYGNVHRGVYALASGLRRRSRARATGSRAS